MSERIHGGNATVHVSSMDRAVDFYTDTLGLELAQRVDDEWAEISAGGGFVIGLRAAGPGTPTPGGRGAVSVCLNVAEGLERVVQQLVEDGVQLVGAIREEQHVRLAFFLDPDGNPFYLAQVKRDARPEVAAKAG
jgi:catechol 2,3-dioxygenase-like lactoylglutathione lyase family enzyme